MCKRTEKPTLSAPRILFGAAVAATLWSATYTLPALADELVLEEIVVTAQRREQNLQEVPVSVTAFTGDMLERSKITDATEYLSLTPNVSFTEGFSTGSRGIGISIRGINNLVTDENTFVNSVGVYLDEFSVAAVPTGVVNPQLQDIERIEVLRGPQGTYFGRNSVGGALNLSTKKPTDEFEGKIIVDAQSFESAGEQYGLTAILNIPISDNFLTRGVFYYEDSSGLVENVHPGGEDSEHDYLMFRLATRWTPNDDTTVDAFIMYTDEDQGADENVPSGVWDIDTVDSFGLGVPATFLSPINPGTGFWPNNRNKLSHDLKEKNENEGIVAIINISRAVSDEIVIKSITGVIDTEGERLFDNDLVGGADLLFRENEIEGTSWSTEIRMEMTQEEFDWVLGLLYARDDMDRQDGVQGGSAPATLLGQNGPDPAGIALLPPFLAGACLACPHKVFELESLALFTDYTWHATDQLDLTVGFRYTQDDVTNGKFNPVTGLPGGKNEEEFNDFSPRFVARYQVNDDIGIYASIAKGYKAGGTSVNNDFRLAGDPIFFTPFDEETLWNYEIGLKSEWLDRRLRLNAAAFYTEWSDMQLESFRFLVAGDLSTNVEEAISVDEAEALGFEIELAALLTEHLTISAGIGILDTEITCSCRAVIKGGFDVDLDGIELPRSPELTSSLIAEYRRPWGDGEGWARLEFIYRDEQTTDIEGATYKQTQGRFTPNGQLPGGTGGFVPVNTSGFPYVSPDYDLVNLRFGYIWNENIEVSGFIENLFDEEYYTGTQEDFGLSGFRLRPHPRIIGGSFSYSF